MAKRDKAEVFTTSLHEIERAIDDLMSEEQVTDVDLGQIPQQYREFADVFSKAASDSMPPSRPCDHSVMLTPESDPTCAVGHAPLYKQMKEQLEAVKAYIEENLQKGFIEPSNCPFASPILMA